MTDVVLGLLLIAAVGSSIIGAAALVARKADKPAAPEEDEWARLMQAVDGR